MKTEIKIIDVTDLSQGDLVTDTPDLCVETSEQANEEFSAEDLDWMEVQSISKSPGGEVVRVVLETPAGQKNIRAYRGTGVWVRVSS